MPGKLAPPALLPRIVCGAHRTHLHFENRLHRFLDLGLGRHGGYLEHQRVLVFLDPQSFFRDHRPAKNLIRGLHYATSAAFSCRVRLRGAREAFFVPSPSTACRWRFETESFSESCSFSIAGCEKIA